MMSLEEEMSVASVGSLPVGGDVLETLSAFYAYRQEQHSRPVTGGEGVHDRSMMGAWVEGGTSRCRTGIYTCLELAHGRPECRPTAGTGVILVQKANLVQKHNPNSRSQGYPGENFGPCMRNSVRSELRSLSHASISSIDGLHANPARL